MIYKITSTGFKSDILLKKNDLTEIGNYSVCDSDYHRRYEQFSKTSESLITRCSNRAQIKKNVNACNFNLWNGIWFNNKKADDKEEFYSKFMQLNRSVNLVNFNDASNDYRQKNIRLLNKRSENSEIFSFESERRIKYHNDFNISEIELSEEDFQLMKNRNNCLNFKKKLGSMKCFKTLDRDEIKSKYKFLDDKQNRINLENILRRKDKRTTIMIRHIPNKYSTKCFLEEINSEFELKYDLFYLPIDYLNNCNLGFAFINFVDPMHAILFYQRFRGKKWRKYNSEKICELAYAKFQGRRDLIAHFERGSFLNFVSEDKRPLILQTPSPLPDVDIPKMFLEAFIGIYPYGSYQLKDNDTFAILTFYNF